MSELFPDQDIEQATKDPEPFSKYQQSFLIPFLLDKQIRETLTTADTEFVLDVVMTIIAEIFDTTEFVMDIPELRRMHPGVRVGRQFATDLAVDIVQGLSIDQILVKKKTLSKKRLTDAAHLIKSLATYTLSTHPTLRSELHTKCHIYMRAGEEAVQREAIRSGDSQVSTVEIMKAVYEYSFLDEAQYYSLGVHVGAIKFGGQPPIGDSDQDIERRRKRSLVTQEALDAARKGVNDRRSAKKSAVKLVHRKGV